LSAQRTWFTYLSQTYISRGVLAINQDVIQRLLTTEARVQSQNGLSGICGEESDAGADDSTNTSIFPMPTLFYQCSIFLCNQRGATNSFNTAVPRNSVLLHSYDYYWYKGKVVLVFN
jgi:hypothetical protein